MRHLNYLLFGGKELVMHSPHLTWASHPLLVPHTRLNYSTGLMLISVSEWVVICMRQLGSDGLTVPQMAELGGKISLFRFIISAEHGWPASQRHEPGPGSTREVWEGVEDEPGTGLRAIGWAEVGSWAMGRDGGGPRESGQGQAGLLVVSRALKESDQSRSQLITAEGQFSQTLVNPTYVIV